MNLYGALASPYVARVVLFAKLKGLELTPVMPERGIKTPEYLALNPMGKMPVLEVEGMAIPESEVICEYLEDLHPGTGGLQGTPIERARARTLLPSLAIFKQTVFPVFGASDPTLGDGKLGRWWSAVAADPVTGPFIEEYGAAVSAFLKMRSSRK